VPVRAQGSLPQREPGGRQQVERPSHGPGLDQSPLLPEGTLNSLRLDFLDPRPEGQLGGGQELGMEAADLDDHLEHRLSCRPLV